MIRYDREFIPLEVWAELLYRPYDREIFRSVVEYFFSASVNARLANAITCSASPILWANTAPRPTELASV